MTTQPKKINILPPNIYNCIAAGEVIARPANVVKELVENSIDAGANAISISIQSGGLQNITVTDNGCGIEAGDVEKAFLPHATSKISKIDDIYNISSMGFRGEALASIASVSNVAITTKTANALAATYLEIGKSKTEKAATTGTTVSISNLFYNTPARLKFLKRPSSEEGEITNIVEKLMLANPKIKFKYTVNGSLLYASSDSPIETIYGADILKHCIEIKPDRNATTTLSGFIGKPDIAKHNRTYQTLVVNGRVVENQNISRAIYNAYGDTLTKAARHPFFVLYLTIPTNLIDVNVHPAKTEIRLSEPYAVETLIGNIISMHLNRELTAEKIIAEDYVAFTPTVQVQGKSFFEPKANVDNLSANRPTQVLTKLLDENFNKIHTAQNVMVPKTFEQQEMTPLKENIRIVGAAFNTYIIAEKDNSIYFIDQHAAHEKLLFDKVNDQMSKSAIATQSLLVPFVVNVSSLESNFLTENIEQFVAVGIDISPFGHNSFKVNSIPSVFSTMPLNTFFSEIFKDLSGLRKIQNNADFIKNRIIANCCRHAIKAGQALTATDCMQIITLLKTNKTVPYCPHGRPIILEFSKDDLEKMFKRRQ